jgi:hypothetical protein
MKVELYTPVVCFILSLSMDEWGYSFCKAEIPINSNYPQIILCDNPDSLGKQQLGHRRTLTTTGSLSRISRISKRHTEELDQTSGGFKQPNGS